MGDGGFKNGKLACWGMSFEQHPVSTAPKPQNPIVVHAPGGSRTDKCFRQKGGVQVFLRGSPKAAATLGSSDAMPARPIGASPLRADTPWRAEPTELQRSASEGRLLPRSHGQWRSSRQGWIDEAKALQPEPFDVPFYRRPAKSPSRALLELRRAATQLDFSSIR